MLKGKINFPVERIRIEHLKAQLGNTQNCSNSRDQNSKDEINVATFHHFCHDCQLFGPLKLTLLYMEKYHF